MLIMPLDDEQPRLLEYHAPSSSPLSYREPVMAGGRNGALVGGCALPLIFFLLAAFVFNDLGGPCFWPIAVVVLGSVGWFVGACIGVVIEWTRWRRRNGA